MPLLHQHWPILLFAPFLLLLASCSDRVSNHYATRSDAEADALFKRGWLPKIIPASSREIVTRNDLDTNHSEGSFSFSPSEADAFLQHLTPTDDSPGKYSYQADAGTWIFSINTGQGTAQYSFLPHSSNGPRP